MADQSTLISLSAISGLVGVILSQTLTGMFAYTSDKRKIKQELKTQYRSKQVEIAESFYYMTGETMTTLKKSIAFWKNRTASRSAISLEFLNKEIKKRDAQLEALQAAQWKYNLVGLYFDVALSYNEIIAANTKSHLLYLRILDLGEKINTCDDEVKQTLYQEYHIAIFDLCNQYEMTYTLLEQDLQKVKTEMRRSFEIAS